MLICYSCHDIVDFHLNLNVIYRYLGKNVMKLVFALVLPCLLSACAGVKFNTNVSPGITEHVQGSVNASKVIEYSAEEIQRYQSSNLGPLVASSCQEEVTSPKPSKYQIKHNLKYQTQQLGGNGFVMMECRHQAFPRCTAYLECRALAYTVDYDGR